MFGSRWLGSVGAEIRDRPTGECETRVAVRGCSRAWPQIYHEAGSRGIAERAWQWALFINVPRSASLSMCGRLHFGMEIHAADPVILVVDRYE